MQLLSLDWPYAVRSLMTFAQRLADARSHATTSPAHVSHALYAMAPVRAIVGDSLKPAVVEAALLMEPKASAIKATLTGPLATLLSGPSARTTPSFLRAYAAGHASAQRVGSVFATHADAIGALLDHPELEPLLSEPSSKAAQKSAPFLSLGFMRGAMAKHGELTTRHVVLGLLAVADKALRDADLPGLEGEIAELMELLDRTTGRGERMVIAPRLFGEVAGALAEGTLESRLAKVCLDGDEAIAFADKAFRDAERRLRAKLKPEEPSA
ncbi:MAG: hypothetical protein JWP87_3697 [Labilithrix sp.]|nr:hypothetical protein [Labilithrix sp.]